MPSPLTDIDVSVQCDQCGEFTVSAGVVAESQRLLPEGCPGSPYECPLQLFASLLTPGIVASLEATGAPPPRAARKPPHEAQRRARLRVRVASRRAPPRRRRPYGAEASRPAHPA